MFWGNRTQGVCLIRSLQALFGHELCLWDVSTVCRGLLMSENHQMGSGGRFVMLSRK